MSQQSDLQRLTVTKVRRLQKLKEIKARQGINTSPELLFEIEDLEAEIEDLQAKLPVEELQEVSTENLTHLKTLLTYNQRRLQLLLEKEARLGLDTSPEVMLEIEDIRNEIEKLEAQIQIAELKKLQRDPADQGVENIQKIIELAARNNSTTLDLSFKRLTSLPLAITRLTKLKKLDLSFNQITRVPSEIGQLSNLESLNLRSNQLSKLSPEVAKLVHLETLDLRTNRLTALPDEIAQLKSLARLELGNNPLPIPSEILAKSNRPTEIISYYINYRDTSSEKRPLNEAKMLIVGEGEVGKTSLMKRFTEDNFNPHETKTEGINIQRYRMMATDKGNSDTEVWLNIWDFGGQEIMHATHQFFLTT